MKQNLFFALFLLVFAGFNQEIYGQKSREIALGYTGIGLDNTFSHGFTTSLLFNPANAKSSFGVSFEQVSSQKIDVNAPEMDNAKLELLSVGGRYQYRLLNNAKFNVDMGIGAAYDRLRYVNSADQGGIVDLGVYTVVKNRESLSTANAMSVQPLLSLRYFIKGGFGLKMEHKYRFALQDTDILTREQLSGYQLSLALFHTF